MARAGAKPRLDSATAAACRAHYASTAMKYASTSDWKDTGTETVVALATTVVDLARARGGQARRCGGGLVGTRRSAWVLAGWATASAFQPLAARICAPFHAAGPHHAALSGTTASVL